MQSDPVEKIHNFVRNNNRPVLGDFYLQSALNNPDKLHIVFIIETSNVNLYNKIVNWVEAQINAQTPIGNIWFSSTDPQKM